MVVSKLKKKFMCTLVTLSNTHIIQNCNKICQSHKGLEICLVSIAFSANSTKKTSLVTKE